MDVEPRDPPEYPALRAGETVDATIDASVVALPAQHSVPAAALPQMSGAAHH